MKSFFIFGVPRSGTTLLCNILNSQKNSTCLVEPHFYMQVHGKYEDENHSFKKGTDPVDFLKNQNYQYGGFKETFRKPWVANHLVNLDEIESHIKSVDFSVAIIRDIRAIWISTIKMWNNKRVNIKTYCKCWNNFCNFVESHNILTVKYEELVSKPEQLVSSLKKLGFKIDVNRSIKSRDTEFLSPHDAHKIKNIHTKSVDKW